jgi:hypothetical protein
MLPSSKTSSAVVAFSSYAGSSGREIFVPGDNDDERQSLLEVEEGRVVVAKKKRNVFAVIVFAVLLVAFAGLATKNDEKDVSSSSSLGEKEEEELSSSSSSNDNDGRRLTFTLYTGCSPMDKVMPALRRRGESEGENDVPYDWSARVGAKLVLKDDDENVGGNDFSFARGIPMEQVSCGTYRATTALMKRGTAFGFALYEISSSSSSSAMSSLGGLIHYENQESGLDVFGENIAVVKDVGCLTSDPERVDKRCPWGERGGVVGGYSDAIAEDEHEHPFGMRECTFKYEYGDVTFYNRVFDGKQLEYVWGSCLESCPAFTKHPFCEGNSPAATTTTTVEEETTSTENDTISDNNKVNVENKNNEEEKEEEEEEEDQPEFTCEDGHYIVSDGDTKSCGECAPGSFSFMPDDTSCQSCPKGFFQPFGKSNRCEACPKGMYQDKEGQKFCNPCDGSEISPDDMTELKMEELQDEGVPNGGIAWKLASSTATGTSSSSSRLGSANERRRRREQNNSNRKLLGGSLFGKEGWFSDDDDENDVNGDGVVDAKDVIEREMQDAHAKGKGAESKDQCVASSTSSVIVDDQDGTVATNDEKSASIDVDITKEMTKDRVIPTPTTIDVVSDEAKEERKEREPEATFESVETTFPDKSRDADDASIAKDDATEDGAKEEARKKSNENDGKEEEFTIDPEVIADEAATLKFSVRHEKELNDLLREKEIDDDDTVVDKKIEKEEEIIETIEEVNVTEREKINQTLASVSAAEEAATIDASLSTSDDDNNVDSSSSTSSSFPSPSSSTASCDETMRGEYGIGYRGCQTTTRTGKSCIDWSKQPFGSKYGVPHAKWSHQSQPEAMEENPRNFCRNPSKSEDGIWCYVDVQGGFDSCEPIGFAGGIDDVVEDAALAAAPFDLQPQQRALVSSNREDVERRDDEKEEDVFAIAAVDRFSPDDEDNDKHSVRQSSSLSVWPSSAMLDHTKDRKFHNANAGES